MSQHGAWALSGLVAGRFAAGPRLQAWGPLRARPPPTLADLYRFLTFDIRNYSGHYVRRSVAWRIPLAGDRRDKGVTTLKRLFAAVLLVGGSVLATPGTASAHLHYITSDETAVITDGQARVTGVIECHLGWVYAITVRLESADGYLMRGNLGGRPICTTEPQPFEIRSTATSPKAQQQSL